MTGFGKSDIQFSEKKIHIEIKSLNSKSLDLSLRVAPLYRDKEMEIRSMISQSLERGKIDFSLWVEKEATAQIPIINTEAVINYKQQIDKICKDFEIEKPNTNFWEVVLRLPEIFTNSTIEELQEEEWNCIRDGVKTAIDNLIEFRNPFIFSI